MNIFVTGATGYIGSAVARQLISAGHRVTGLARSEGAAHKLKQHGIHPHRGDLMDRASILAGARPADAAIHAGAPGDETNAAADTITVGALIDVFAETGKCFIYTSGIWILGATGSAIADECWPLDPPPLVSWRRDVEGRVRHFQQHGVRTVVIRPGVVYGHGKGIPAMVPYVGDGSNHWPVVDVDDLARLYLLALEKAEAGSLFLAVSGNVLVSDAARARGAETISLDTARTRMGSFADALVLDQQATGERARRLLGWAPSAPSLLEDLRSGSYVQP